MEVQRRRWDGRVVSFASVVPQSVRPGLRVVHFLSKNSQEVAGPEKLLTLSGGSGSLCRLMAVALDCAMRIWSHYNGPSMGCETKPGLVLTTAQAFFL